MSIISLASVLTLASCVDTTTDPITGPTGPAGQNGQNGAYLVLLILVLI